MSNPEPPPPPSDFGGTPPPPPGQGAGSPPPPPAFQQQQPPPPGQAPPAPGQMPGQMPGQFPGQAPPAYAGQPGMAGAKPPRPDVKLGAILVIVGAVLGIIGVFLPWATAGGDSFNGTASFLTDDFTFFEGPGIFAIIMGVIILGLGIALFFAGRVLAVAIIAIIAATIAGLFGVGMIGMVDSATAVGDSLFNSADIEPGLGIGVILLPLSALVSLAGSIVATSKRRRWPTA